MDRFAIGIFDCALKQNVNTEDYGIPSDLNGFTQISKSVTSNSDWRFKSLFAAIQDNSEILALKKSLKYLSESRYVSDNECLKKIFRGEEAIIN